MVKVYAIVLMLIISFNIYGESNFLNKLGLFKLNEFYEGTLESKNIKEYSLFPVNEGNNKYYLFRKGGYYYFYAKVNEKIEQFMIKFKDCKVFYISKEEEQKIIMLKCLDQSLAKIYIYQEYEKYYPPVFFEDAWLW